MLLTKLSTLFPKDYSFFSWLLHLTDCILTLGIGISSNANTPDTALGTLIPVAIFKYIHIVNNNASFVGQHEPTILMSSLIARLIVSLCLYFTYFSLIIPKLPKIYGTLSTLMLTLLSLSPLLSSQPPDPQLLPLSLLPLLSLPLPSLTPFFFPLLCSILLCPQLSLISLIAVLPFFLNDSSNGVTYLKYKSIEIYLIYVFILVLFGIFRKMEI